ncbi:MAG: hypothetical protein K6C36_04510 [Clostridia bacterium]|nr:hypothetical protein [Clostridia bacterium]
MKRRLLSLVLAVVLTAALAVPATVRAEGDAPAVFGDYTGDGGVYADDARHALRAAIALEAAPKLGTAELNRADMDGNCKIEAADAQRILQISVGINADDKTRALELYNAILTRVKSCSGSTDYVTGSHDSDSGLYINRNRYRFTYFNQSDDVMTMSEWSARGVLLSSARNTLEESIEKENGITYSYPYQNSSAGTTSSGAWNFPLFYSDNGTRLVASDLSSVKTESSKTANALANATLSSNKFSIDGARYLYTFDLTKLKNAQSSMTGLKLLTMNISNSTGFTKLPWDCSATRFLDLFNENFDTSALGDGGETDDGDVFTMQSTLTDLNATNMSVRLWYDPVTLEPVAINFSAKMTVTMSTEISIIGQLTGLEVEHASFDLTTVQNQNYFYMFTGTPVSGSVASDPIVRDASIINASRLYPSNAIISTQVDKQA